MYNIKTRWSLWHAYARFLWELHIISKINKILVVDVSKLFNFKIIRFKEINKVLVQKAPHEPLFSQWYYLAYYEVQY